jgi:hypothetical protein
MVQEVSERAHAASLKAPADKRLHFMLGELQAEIDRRKFAGRTARDQIRRFILASHERANGDRRFFRVATQDVIQQAVRTPPNLASPELTYLELVGAADHAPHVPELAAFLRSQNGKRNALWSGTSDDVLRLYLFDDASSTLLLLRNDAILAMLTFHIFYTVDGVPGAHIAALRRGADEPYGTADGEDRATAYLHSRLDDLMCGLVAPGAHYHVISDSVGWRYVKPKGVDEIRVVPTANESDALARQHWSTHLAFTPEATIIGMQLKYYGEVVVDASCRWAHEMRQRPRA